MREGAEITATPARRAGAGLRLSLVAPVLNEEAVIGAFLDAVTPALGAAAALMGEGADWEILFVDDGSDDATWPVLLAAAAGRPDLRLLRLSRNFGKDAALAAGLAHATGDAVIPIDVDLQDPPEAILEMVRAWRGGAQVVNALRIDRGGDSWLKRRTAAAFYRLYNRIAARPIPGDVGDFRLLDREVVDTLNALPERTRFMKGLFAWVGYETATVPYVRAPRVAGTSKWRYWRLWNFALDGITGSSTAPLRVWTYLGLAVALAALVYAGVVVARTLVFGRETPGYASLMVVTLTLGAFNLISLGILGEYVGRIAAEVRQRPLYVVRDRRGFGRDGAAQEGGVSGGAPQRS